jgi:NAD(P)H-dependent FMN reductase
MELNIPVILGTAREGRASEHVAEFVVDYLNREVDEISTELIDVRDYTFGQTYEAWNDHPDVPGINDWKEVADNADGYVIVTPEYNHGYPGELKILLDAAFAEYFDKPVGLVGVSTGGFGGARVVELIKPTLIELGMTVMGDATYVSHVGDAFADDGSVAEGKRDKIQGQLDDMTDELVRYGQTCNQMRDEPSA